ncbi:MAG: YebC/PmpR family DNA-binding transcriptional regulator, partial [Clostridia bacterium]|nr:YebC/PmpR family DNA-binding transcriptional regulator [Clostridia bacterium]
PREVNAYLTVAAPSLNIVYEDENIILVDKKPGQAVHPHDGAEYGRTLIDVINVATALQEKGYTFESAEAAYIPATTTVLTDEEHLFKMNRMLDMMEEDDDIQHVWHSWAQSE